jgi:imidazolonepropionase-like amidohydrolase
MSRAIHEEIFLLVRAPVPVARSPLLALTLVLCAISGCSTARPEPPPDLVITDVTLVSPERPAPLEHAYVRIRDGRIVEVSSTPLSAGDGEQAIDGRSRYLVPGLIDSHVHLGTIPGMRRDQESSHRAVAEIARAQIPRSYLYFGFTTVVDIAGEVEVVAAWNDREERPDAHFCGGAPLANGYGMNGIPEAIRYQVARYFLYDARQADRIPDSVDPDAHSPEAVVARMASDGAICVKTFYESGFGADRGTLPTPTLEMIRRLVAAAHARGLPVFMHANSLDAHAFAVAAGVDSTAHGMWNGLPADVESSDRLASVVREIVEQDIGYQPTLQVLHGLVDLFDGEYLSDPQMAEAVPAPLLAWYRTPEAQFFREELARDFGNRDPATVLGETLERRDRVVARLANSNAQLLFGTDTPSAPTWANPAGLNGLFEMRRWVRAGVGEDALFRALTIDNARALGLDHEIGTLEPGKRAHLLLLRGNPLESVEAYETIETVFLAGRPIPRGRLSARRTP